MPRTTKREIPKTLPIEEQKKLTTKIALTDPRSKGYFNPSFVGAITLQSIHQFKDERFSDIKILLNEHVEKIKKGDLSSVEEILAVQIFILNSFFNVFLQEGTNFSRIKESERFMRLTLKAQNQCRITAETLVYIKNPFSATFVKQANIGYNQQVNNNSPSIDKAEDSKKI